MKLTLSVDERIVRRARQRARAMGKSLNQVIREHLERLAAETDPDAAVVELQRLWRKANGHSRGWRFSRHDLHGRSRA